MNSTPLTYVSVNRHDGAPLTPLRFLLGQPCYVPDVDVHLVPHKACMRKRWEDAQAIMKDIWQEWVLGYVPNRIEHQTWLKDRRNLKVGDLVMMMEPDKRGSFPCGRIFKVFAGEDAYDDAINIHRPAMQALYEWLFSSNNLDAILFPTTRFSAPLIDALKCSYTLVNRKSFS